MENHGTSTGNIKALRFYHVLAPTSRGFNSVSTDNFPIFGETWGNWKWLVMGWRWMEDRGLGGSFILWGAKQLLGGVQHHGQARNGAGTLHGGCAAREPNGWGNPGTSCKAASISKPPMGCVSYLPMLSFALQPGPGLEDTIGKCTAGHPAGFWRKSLKRLAENHMCHGQTKVCFLNKRDWSSLHN